MNQIAIVFGIIITAVVSVGAYTALAPLVTQSENRNMEAEIINVINAASEYRWVHRNNAGADSTFEALVDNGYLDQELYDDGDDDNIIGLDITADPMGDDEQVTYAAGDPESCNWLEQRVDNGKWPNTSNEEDDHDCDDDGVLTVTIE